ncbi:hypothetical protein Nepgr_008147 [Nepenthes gracilis]|uniref:Uncharacterized protein n=1 Tax=Nepenthes gracilis TaxID=150966 RepID=A0AAD3S870_NEPGR|nr:hypothetical protein Nepgr_008147 [Nepenthes gracilis]
MRNNGFEAYLCCLEIILSKYKAKTISRFYCCPLELRSLIILSTPMNSCNLKICLSPTDLCLDVSLLSFPPCHSNDISSSFGVGKRSWQGLSALFERRNLWKENSHFYA